METTALAERKNQSGMMEVASSRQAQEVQAAVIMAQRFPRDITKALTRVIEDCKRKSLAEKAIYQYPRGGQQVSGPSIRLAEAIAKSYGNLDFGVVELEKRPSMGNLPGESILQSYCWDLETNTRSTKIFTVTHKRDSRNGSTKLTDERDIYEIAANNGARRLRACILSVIPADIVELALEECRKTLKSNSGPIVDRVRAMVIRFKEIGVSQQMLEKHLGHAIDLTTEDEIIDLTGVYTSIKDGMAERADFFELGPQSAESATAAEVVTTEQPKSIKTIKNYAPQTQVEADELNKERARNAVAQAAADSQGSPAKAAAETNADEPNRQNLIGTLLNFQKALKLSNVAFKAEIMNLTSKELNQLTSSDLINLCRAFEGRVINQKQAGA